MLLEVIINKNMEDNKNNKKQVIRKDDLIRLISNKSQYSITDTKIFFDAFLSVLEDIVSEQIELNVSGLGKLKVHEHSPLDKNGRVKKRWVWDKENDRRYQVDDHWYQYLTFSLSPVLKNIVKQNKEE
jgi:nucleoid DNA-binding protein